ncbi:protein snail homolog Sna-like isoform X2 [Bradysia coprophila]|uniref:protein snail homolog Sna-like isoform X2 n=1 Tax=Bradysia coprophila TaxID=38358 RepID=UPI00187DB12B|nr:protein snail homolog Sna-like isoform X2 [Bradysia coprophila]
MFSHLCRMCLEQFNDPSDVVPLFEPHENIYYYRICHELQLMVYEDDQLGSNVCRSCSENIMKFYKFVLTYKESDQKLREMLMNATVTLDDLIEVKPNIADSECDVKDTTDLINVDADTKEYFPKLTISPVPDPAVSEESRIKTVSKKVQMQCRLCPQRFTLRKYLEKHMRQQHFHTQKRPNATEEYECDICSKRFISKTKIRQHLITHINEGRRKFLCVACGNQFCSKFGLAQHISAIHDKEQKFQCTKCNRRFAHKHNLKTHMNRHNGIRPYACSAQMRTFAVFAPRDLIEMVI